MNEKPLSGLRVLELSTYVAAPSCGRMLADYGAEVIKIESAGGDAWRLYGNSMKVTATEKENPVFDIVNSGKKGIVLDLKNPEAKTVLERLLEKTDIFLTNTRPKSLQRLGLDYESLKDRYPSLIHASITGFGDKGPLVDDPGFDNVAFWAKSGFLADMCVETPGNYPVMAPTGVGDMTTGTVLFSAISMALFQRQKTGRGDRVTVSLYGTALWIMCNMIIRTQDRYRDKFPKTREECNPMVSSFRCLDGEWIMLTILEFERYFPALCRVTGLEELLDDPRFKTTEKMLAHRYELTKLLEEKFITRNADEWKKLLTENDIVNDRLPHFSDAEKSEQAWENGFIEKFAFESGESCILPRPSPRFNGITLSPTRRGPLLGEDSESVLKELGFSEEEADRLINCGAVRGR
ncbi:MAG: CaiB/BaiF CoA transferase family protein [Aminivibrio sp.]|jgi:crotonobetainyl-CoA:carnitine CoA-transferase CaiB-like acyl-CoA transferase